MKKVLFCIVSLLIVACGSGNNKANEGIAVVHVDVIQQTPDALFAPTQLCGTLIATSAAGTVSISKLQIVDNKFMTNVILNAGDYTFDVALFEANNCDAPIENGKRYNGSASAILIDCSRDLFNGNCQSTLVIVPVFLAHE